MGMVCKLNHTLSHYSHACFLNVKLIAIGEYFLTHFYWILVRSYFIGYKNVNSYNEHGAVENIPLSIKSYFEVYFKIVAQFSAVTRIQRMSYDSLCHKVKKLLTAPSKEISLCDKFSEVQSDISFLEYVKRVAVNSDDRMTELQRNFILAD